jgi:hypothetical protein
MRVGIGRQTFVILLRNKEAAQFYFWKYINGSQIFILDSHRPFICSAEYTTLFLGKKGLVGFLSVVIMQVFLLSQNNTYSIIHFFGQSVLI